MDKEFLIKYLNTDSPSTFETEAQEVWIEKMKKYSSVIDSDNYGNVVAKIGGGSFKVVIDAHADEISWLVREITSDGFIKVKCNGGTDNNITPNTRVRILTDNGKKIHGFFGSIPIHFQKEFNTNEEKLYVDVAATSDEDVKNMGIDLGDYIVPYREAEILNNKYVVGKSLDDKIGGFILTEVAKYIKNNNIELPYELNIVNSVQEEIGLRGAKMITETIKPNIAICFDVTFDTNTPNISKEKYGDFKIGNGVVLRKGYDVHPKLLKFIKQIADDKQIPVKYEIGGAGGTNTTAYNLSNSGVVTATMSIPLRGMHTQNEMVSLDDVECAVKLIVEVLQNIENNHNFKLI